MRPIPLLLILSALALPALSRAAVRVEVLQNRLAQPWGMAFLPDDQGILITLRGGE
ncbi:PQQ-dependent sugar dehydrogenase, partial [Klebsiella pneumoniae]|nr:PQQ-dependent sugar dehydrogenase [Escherichia coli]MDN7208059.1 PQQ-dependent sugar dehydrogenase [Klebsiella pneumoniae]